jgi:uncharacterized protein YegJ (DUF2314 family)
MFETIAGIIIVGGALLAFMAYQRSQAPASTVNPIAEDDPDMIAARATAQSKLEEFRELYSRYPNASLVKLPVTASSGTLEWMVGEVVELTDVFVKVQFRGRPVTHRGAFQSLQTFPVREIADWHVVTDEGRYRGGFTQRVHFDRMRAAGKLVGRDAEESAKYE